MRVHSASNSTQRPVLHQTGNNEFANRISPLPSKVALGVVCVLCVQTRIWFSGLFLSRSLHFGDCDKYWRMWCGWHFSDRLNWRKSNAGDSIMFPYFQFQFFSVLFGFVLFVSIHCSRLCHIYICSSESICISCGSTTHDRHMTVCIAKPVAAVNIVWSWMNVDLRVGVFHWIEMMIWIWNSRINLWRKWEKTIWSSTWLYCIPRILCVRNMFVVLLASNTSMMLYIRYVDIWAYLSEHTLDFVIFIFHFKTRLLDFCVVWTDLHWISHVAPRFY